MRKCLDCDKDETEVKFRNINKTNGKKYKSRRCVTCFNSRKYVADKIQGHYSKSLDRKSLSRKNPKLRSKYILQDSRRTDRKAGRENNLTQEFINENIKHPCFYCGATELKMTLDRIDNNVGHVIGNVNPACISCNILRKAMPYEAWLIIAEAVRKVRKLGLFGDWLNSGNMGGWRNR